MFSLWLRTRYEYRMRQRDSPFVSFAADTKHYELSIEPLTCCSSVGRATMVVPPAVACCHNAGRGAPMKKYGTFVGLDVHARSISACALDPLTGEITEGRFGAQAGALAEWALAFDSPPCVYESGPAGWHLARELRAPGVDCVAGASPKMLRPPADRGRKTDRRDAEFLARLLATRSITEVWVPDEECEAARDLSRALEDARCDLQRARRRLSKFLLRHGHVYNELTPAGARRGAWTAAHARWLDKIGFGQEDGASAHEYYRDCVRRRTEAKSDLERRVARSAGEPRWKPAADAIRCLKGDRRGHGACPRGRGRRLLPLQERLQHGGPDGPRALRALERRDRLEGRDHQDGERPCEATPDRGGLACPHGRLRPEGACQGTGGASRGKAPCHQGEPSPQGEAACPRGGRQEARRRELRHRARGGGLGVGAGEDGRGLGPAMALGPKWV